MSFVLSQQRSFPEHWEVLPFDEAIADVTGGNAKVLTSDYLEQGALPVIDQGQRPIAGYVDDSRLACRASLPCILFGDHTRIIKFADKPFALGADGVKVLSPRVGLHPRFVYHYLQTVRLPLDLGYSRHFKYLRETLVPRPPLGEQRRIADILDRADAIRRKRKQAIALTEELLRATFLDMFGDIAAGRSQWPFGTCRDATVMTSGKGAKSVLSEHATAVPIYGGNGINGFATEALFAEPVIVVGRVGQHCGITHLTTGPAWVTDNAIVVRIPDESKMDMVYLATAFQHAPIGHTVTRLDLPFINQEMLRSLAIPLPPIDLQRRFRAVHEHVTKSQDRLNAALADAERVFNALVAGAFGMGLS